MQALASITHLYDAGIAEDGYQKRFDLIRSNAKAISERLWTEREFFVEDVAAFNVTLLLYGLSNLCETSYVFLAYQIAPLMSFTRKETPPTLLRHLGHMWLNKDSSHLISSISSVTICGIFYDTGLHCCFPDKLEQEVFLCSKGDAMPFALEIMKRSEAAICHHGAHFQWMIRLLSVLTSKDPGYPCFSDCPRKRRRRECSKPSPLLLALRKVGYLKTLVKAALEELKIHDDSVRGPTIRHLGVLMYSLSNKPEDIHNVYDAVDSGLLQLLKKCIDKWDDNLGLREHAPLILLVVVLINVSRPYRRFAGSPICVC